MDRISPSVPAGEDSRVSRTEMKTLAAVIKSPNNWLNTSVRDLTQNHQAQSSLNNFSKVLETLATTERISYLQTLAQSETTLDNFDLQGILILKIWMEETKTEPRSPLLHLIFDVLAKIPLTRKLARQSQIGSYINSLVKQAADSDIRERAKNLVQDWKASLKDATTKPVPQTPINISEFSNPKKRLSEAELTLPEAKKPKLAPSSPTPPDIPPPVATKKKSVSWAPEGKLEQVRIFKKDRAGRAAASPQSDAQQERFILLQNKKHEEEEWLIDLKQMKPKMQWVNPKPHNIDSHLLHRGENSPQALWQDKYVNEVESIAFYVKDSDIPPTPREQYIEPLKMWTDNQILNIPAVRQYQNPIQARRYSSGLGSQDYLVKSKEPPLFWGSDEFQEAYQSTHPKDKPKPLGQLEKSLLISAAFGVGQTFVTTSTGELYSWGLNFSGELGHSNGQTVKSPALNHSLDFVCAVCCGASHTLCLTKGSLWSWGSSQYGQIGNGTYEASFAPRGVIIDPRLHSQITSMACGFNHNAVVADGCVFSWGSNSNGQCGGHQETDILRPTLQRSLLGWKALKVSCGKSHTAVLCLDINNDQTVLFLCGKNTKGQLGLGHRQVVTDFQQNSFFFGKKIIDIATGHNHTLVLTEHGQVWGFGSNKYGQLGLGFSGGAVDIPSLIDFTGKVVFQIDCGGYHSGALTNQGCYLWGRGTSGQIGNNDVANQISPQLVLSRNIKQIKLGFNRSAILAYENQHQKVLYQIIQNEQIFLSNYEFLQTHPHIQQSSVGQAILPFIEHSSRYLHGMLNQIRIYEYQGILTSFGELFKGIRTPIALKSFWKGFLDLVACGAVQKLIEEVGDAIPAATLDGTYFLEHTRQYKELFGCLTSLTSKEHREMASLEEINRNLEKIYKKMKNELPKVQDSWKFISTKLSEQLHLFPLSTRFIKEFELSTSHSEPHTHRDLYAFTNKLLIIETYAYKTTFEKAVHTFDISCCWLLSHVQECETTVVLVSPEKRYLVKMKTAAERNQFAEIMEACFKKMIKKRNSTFVLNPNMSEDEKELFYSSIPSYDHARYKPFFNSKPSFPEPGKERPNPLIGKIRVGSYQFSNDHPEFRACVYHGEWAKGQMNGFGVLAHPADYKYIGFWNAGAPHGIGIHECQGYIYMGKFFQKKKQGFGKITYASGEISSYAGNWRANKRQGFGKAVFANQNRYFGFWNEGAIEGFGVMIFPDRSRYFGMWKNASRDGIGLMLYAPTSEMYFGEWNSGVIDGQGVYAYNVPSSNFSMSDFTFSTHVKAIHDTELDKYFGYSHPFKTAYYFGTFNSRNDVKGMLHVGGFTFQGSFKVPSVTNLHVINASVIWEPPEETNNGLFCPQQKDFSTPRFQGTSPWVTPLWAAFTRLLIEEIKMDGGYTDATSFLDSFIPQFAENFSAIIIGQFDTLEEPLHTRFMLPKLLDDFQYFIDGVHQELIPFFLSMKWAYPDPIHKRKTEILDRVFFQCFPVILNLYKVQYSKIETKYEKKLKMLSQIPKSALLHILTQEMKSSSTIKNLSFDPAIHCIQLMIQETSPTRKIALIQDSISHITKQFTSEAPPGADEMFPLFVYLLLSSGATAVHSNCCFLADFVADTTGVSTALQQMLGAALVHVLTWDWAQYFRVEYHFVGNKM